jgi:flagellar protein FliO/FliZ
MFETLFGEGQYGLKMVFAFIVVLGLIALTAWLVRRFGAERLGANTTRGRQPRLAVIDATSVDGRRRLVLIRRDNVEHLMMIGGPTDVVVEANIVRGAQQPRDAQAPRPAAAPDTLPRAVPLGEGSMWPLQPEPAAVPAPAPRAEPAARAHRPAPPPAPMAEEPPHWQAEPELAPPPPQQVPQRRARPAPDPLAGLAEELSRAPAPAPEQSNGDARAAPPRREPRMARPQPAAAPTPPPAPPPAAPADAHFNSAADQNLAEMAQRLEAALRRPGKPDDGRFGEPAPRAEQATPDIDEEQASPSPAQSQRTQARPARSDKPAAAGKSSLYDSLEQEMASLLGRPNKP